MQNKQSNTQSRPLVSFIVAYYNLPLPMLTTCLASITALSLRPFEREILLIDDGSDKSPIDELRQYADELVYIRSKNRGLSAARNLGLQMATGQFVQFVDADDWLIQAPYEHCLDIARYGKADLILFDFTHEDTSAATYHTTDAVSGNSFMRHNNLRATAWGYLFRLSILGELRFTPGIYHEDEEFTPQLMLRAEHVVATDARAYHYRKRDDSITGSRDEQQATKRLDDLKGVLTRLNRLADTLPMEAKAAMQRRVAQLTMDYIYMTIMARRDRRFLDERLDELTAEGLYPLPARDYTQKYTWFRRLANTSVGLTLLEKTLPKLPAER